MSVDAGNWYKGIGGYMMYGIGWASTVPHLPPLSAYDKVSPPVWTH
jgi:hypothetical protein